MVFNRIFEENQIDNLENYDDINPYIAFTDLMINLILVLIFFIASITVLGKIGWEQVKYKDVQKEVKESIKSQLNDFIFDTYGSISFSQFRNDPPGAQRWVIYSQKLFEENSYKLTKDGKTKLEKLAKVLIYHHEKTKIKYGQDKYLSYTWRRIRIEGHTKPTKIGQKENWELSAMRAAIVANILTASGIPPWFISISARGGQTPFDKSLSINDPKHERVEIILEYQEKEK
jgi:chemotaxis protein MotB